MNKQEFIKQYPDITIKEELKLPDNSYFIVKTVENLLSYPFIPVNRFEKVIDGLMFNECDACVKPERYEVKKKVLKFLKSYGYCYGVHKYNDTRGYACAELSASKDFKTTDES